MEFSKELIEIFNFLFEKFGIAIDWSGDNIVPYIKELCGKYIKWEIATSITWMAIVVIVTIILWIVAAKGDNGDGFLTLCAVVASIITLIVVSFQVFDIVECMVFPEKAIYDYIMDVKNGMR